MRFNRARVVGAATLLAVAMLAAACGSSGDDDVSSDTSETTTTEAAPKQKVVIGSFNFSESAILAHMYAKALEADGYPVEVRANLGSREVVAPALEKGEIGLYPGYVATELEFLNKGKGEASGDVNATVQKLRSYLEPKSLTALEPSPAIDANAFAVTKATADELGLVKLSDVAAKANGKLVLGGPPECPTRPFCQPGLEKTYKIKFKSFKPLDAGGPLSKGALEKGDVDIALVFSSDGAIPAKGFVVLEDDKKLQNADNIVPIISFEASGGNVAEILNKISATLTTADLSELNKRADIDKEDPEALAEEYLKAKKLID